MNKDSGLLVFMIDKDTQTFKKTCETDVRHQMFVLIVVAAP